MTYFRLKFGVLLRYGDKWALTALLNRCERFIERGFASMKTDLAHTLRLLELICK